MSHTIALNQLSTPQAWVGKTQPYGSKEIEAIPDGQGGNTALPPTSIPSPFARFDLVRTAFLRLNRSIDLTGKPNDERLVSACFDIGQLFFHFDQFSDQLELIAWPKKASVDLLINEQASDGHKRLGKALNLFLNQDGGPAKAKEGEMTGYNFLDLDSLFMLHYTGQGRSLMVGGTSPSTLFFSAPEDLSFIQISFGNYRLFQRDNTCPLHRRNDPPYQKFWYGFLNETIHPGFSSAFPEVHDYLMKSLKLLQKNNSTLWGEIGINADKLTLAVNTGLFQNLEPVEVLGFKIKKEKPNTKVFTTSGFLIDSDKFRRLYPDELMPMILESEYKGNLRYTRDKWDKTQLVPSFVAQDWRINKRHLPGQPEYYPWLTVSDLLEPYIIRLVYPINRAKFFDASPAGADHSQSYLLPLSQTFFDFFDVDDLYKLESRVQLIMLPVGADSVEVTLAITLDPNEPPVRLKRTYQGLGVSGKPHTHDPNQNKGAVVECQVGVNLMPFVRFKTVSPHYSVQVVDRDINAYTLGHNFRLTFCTADNKRLQIDEPPRQRSHKQADNPASTTTSYYGLTENFDYMILETAPGSGQRGVIVPRFDKATTDEGSDVFTFAVDFGTTSTHIEYIVGDDKAPKAMTMGVSGSPDAPIATLHDPDVLRLQLMKAVGASALLDVIPVEWLPDQIGKPARAGFPTRTALLENKPLWSQNLYAFQDFSPALLYEKQPLPRANYTVATNLKWASYNRTDDEGIRGEKRVVGYLESLMLLIRKKVLLNKGNLAKTQLVWFYPLSMTRERRDFFGKEWDKLFARHISKTTFPQRIPESTAPYYWFGRQIAAVEFPAVNIDIGGGTSDVVVFRSDGEEDQPVLISSFRFAANAIFGDAFVTDGAAENNGFVKRYKDQIVKLLNDNSYTDLLNTYTDIYSRGRSEDIIAFFFSLKENQEVQKKVAIDFSEMLAKDNSMKIIFLTFYGALIYHLARLMQARQLPMPRYISFSGNGSKVLSILSTRPTTLASFAQLIFEKVYGMPYHAEGLDIVMNQVEPKEATCRGGLKRSLQNGEKELNSKNPDSYKLDFTRPDTGQADERIEDLKAVLLGIHQGSSTTEARFVARRDTYNTIDDATLNSVADEVRSFIELLFKLDEDISLKDKFGIKVSDLPAYSKILLKDLSQNVKIGFQAKKREAGATSTVEETLFFYPLLKALNALATSIAN